MVSKKWYVVTSDGVFPYDLRGEVVLETVFPAVGLLFIGQVFVFLGRNREFE